MFKEPVEDKFGNRHWYNSSHQHHREDGPAIEYANGDLFWYYKGLLHREDGPAVILATGEEHWFYEDVRHCDRGPAYTGGDVSEWWVDGKLLHHLSLVRF
jgi:hypothetical protein